MLKLNKWTLEISQVDAKNVFTSYGGFEMRLIIEDFQLASQTRVDVAAKAHPTNLYRDDIVRTYIL